MRDFRNLSARKPARIAAGAAGACIAAFLLSGSSCPTPEPALPERLSAPRVQSPEMAITAVHCGSEYRAAVHLEWLPPQNDSGGVATFTVLRNSIDKVDSGFIIVRQGIPGDITSLDDVVDDIGFPPTCSYRLLYYRVLAIDRYGRSSDTSAIDSFTLAAQPAITTPLDTLDIPCTVSWQMGCIMMPYRSFLRLWSQSGLVWESPKPVELSYGTEHGVDYFAAAVPDSLHSRIAGGTCWLGAVVEAQAGDYAQSIALRKLVVR